MNLNRLLLRGVLGVVLFGACGPGARGPSVFTAKQIAEDIKRCTVKIEGYIKETDMLLDDEFSWSGSGVIVYKNEDGDYWIATNSHVWGYYTIVEADDDKHPEIKEYVLKVTFWDGNHTSPTVVFDHTSEDCGILLVPGTVGDYPFAKTVDVLPSVGDTVYAMGHPLDLDFSFTKGMVSAIRDRSSDDARPFRRVQFDAAISPGSSGGPLVDNRGEVIGLTTYSRREGQNLNFALFYEDVLRDMADNHFNRICLDAPSLTEFFQKVSE